MAETVTADQRVSALEEKARKLIEKANAMKKRKQERCKHPYKSLRFREGASTSYELNGDVTHSMTVMCSLCDAWFNDKLVIRRDIY